MTKGALYHHFDSKEALASAIIEEGSDALLGAFRNVCGSASPALENMIHGTFAVAHLLNADKTARAAEQLTAVLAGFNSAAAQFFGACAGEMAGQARRAIAEGDLRDDVDPELVGESIVGATFGMRLLANALSRSGGNGYRVESAGQRLGQLWGLLLPGMTVETSLPYFREFLAREAMRSRH